MRRVIALATTLTLWLAFPAVAGGPNNVVLASPTADGALIHRSSVKVGSTGADSITSSNIASATPHDCTGCEGIAVAFQAIIVTGKPSDFRPTNAAVAVNSNCTSCGAFAFAYQYTVQADRGTHLSRDGRAKIAMIRQQANEAVDAGLPYDQLDAKLKALSTDFKTAVLSDLDRSGADPHDGSRDADADEAPVGT
jgi:putative peptide zinc metalloprotease protein